MNAPMLRPSAWISGQEGRQQASFGSCIWRTLELQGAPAKPGCGLEVHLSYDTDAMQLTLAPEGFDNDFAGVKPKSVDATDKSSFTSVMQHAELCPAAALEDRGLKAGEGHVRVAVAVVVEDHKGRVLLTKRGDSMRAFPGVWVVPGGHVDPGESLEAAAAREVKEETGIEISQRALQVLGVWESNYPHLLDLGKPQRQHLVVYFAARVEEASGVRVGHGDEDQLQAVMQEVEVGAVAWVWPSSAELIIGGKSAEERSVAVQTPDAAQAGQVVLSVLGLQAVAEKLSEGTRFALARWLESRERFRV